MTDTMSLADEAQAVNAALADPPPMIAPPPDTSVQLMRGLLDPVSGEWQTDAVVREMNGADEEALAALDARGSTTYGHYMSTLLARTVVSIGSVSDVSEEALDQLIAGDRDLLFLGVVRATYGETKTFQVTCRKCDESNDFTVHLRDDFPVKEVDYDLRSTREVIGRRGRYTVRLPTGEDHKIVGEKATNLAEQNTMIISRCVVWEGSNRPADPLEWAKNLNTGDRQLIIKAVLGDQPGPQLEEVKAPCANCGEEITVVIDWASLLLA